MLVLLIIFIITAPMLVQGLSVNLPKQQAPALNAKGDEPLILTLTRDQVILLGDEPVHLKLLPDRLGAVLGGAPKPVYLKADESLPYGFVIRCWRCSIRSASSRSGWSPSPRAGKWTRYPKFSPIARVTRRGCCPGWFWPPSFTASSWAPPSRTVEQPRRAPLTFRWCRSD